MTPDEAATTVAHGALVFWGQVTAVVAVLGAVTWLSRRRLIDRLDRFWDRLENADDDVPRFKAVPVYRSPKHARAARRPLEQVEPVPDDWYDPWPPE